MSATNNYFKSAGFFFFFVDFVLESVEDAFRAASLVGKPAIYHPAEVVGPWDRCNIIGHHSRAEILRDINDATTTNTTPTERDLLEDELQAIHEAFLDAGRHVPPMGIAA